MQTRLILCVIVSAALFRACAAAAFSDTNWVSLGGLPGANGPVYAAVADGSGNLYIGGNFTEVGNVVAINIARWDGTSWSALGSGVNGWVQSLAVSGSNVYAAGIFTTAGSALATNIAKWDGNAWSALGSGIAGEVPFPPTGVTALAVLGNDVYAGGNFTTAGGNSAQNIAKWNGSTWSALGSGMG